MSNTNWEKQELAALFTIAEDIDRFDPWESNVAPFVLHDPQNPDTPVLVVFGQDDAGMHDIRFIFGNIGMRNWLMEDGWELSDGSGLSTTICCRPFLQLLHFQCTTFAKWQYIDYRRV